MSDKVKATTQVVVEANRLSVEQLATLMRMDSNRLMRALRERGRILKNGKNDVVCLPVAMNNQEAWLGAVRRAVVEVECEGG